VDYHNSNICAKIFQKEPLLRGWPSWWQLLLCEVLKKTYYGPRHVKRHALGLLLRRLVVPATSLPGLVAPRFHHASSCLRQRLGAIVAVIKMRINLKIKHLLVHKKRIEIEIPKSSFGGRCGPFVGVVGEVVVEGGGVGRRCLTHRLRVNNR
jgi:hypothetical protein